MEQSDIRKSLVKKLSEMMKQEFKTHGRKYQVFPYIEICCWEVGGERGVGFKGANFSGTSVQYQ